MTDLMNAQVVVITQSPVTKVIEGNYVNSYTKSELDNNLAAFELQYTLKINRGSHMEFTEVDGNVIQVNYWEDNTKALKLFTKDIIYNGTDPVQIIIKDEITGKVLTTQIHYNGLLITGVTKTLS